ncbi:MAG: LacI family DNA-binding transcriptional regulator [Saprospiraceae bacterium]|nr:LacI family DNA-binding transcriptional regulator [Saprospiraceae bacterium]
MKRITIKDIAALAGVNISTVSRALKDHPDIGLTLRDKIKKLAQDLHYHPNMMAVQLRRQKSRTIGLIIPDTNTFFIPSLIKGISSMVKQHGYRLLVLQSGESFEQEIENVHICNEYGVEGLLISLTNKTEHLEHLDAIQEAGISVVLVDKILENTHFDSVIIDDSLATATCLDYLLQTGCTRILGMFGNPKMNISLKRLRGFEDKIQNCKGIKATHLFADDTFAAWEGVETTYPNFKPDGIFAMSDETMAGVIPALKRLKVKIPQECAVIGISDGYLPRILDPEVTYLHHDGFNLGKKAAERLFVRLNQKFEQLGQIDLSCPTALVINKSTR